MKRLYSSEYNPILLFSEEDEKAYARKNDKTERNERNAPNRRDMVFFFSKKLLALTPAEVVKAWPCPAWNEGPSPCEAHFWPDSKERLKNGDRERRYDKGDRTMACRWYDAMARLSPCEGPARPARAIAEMNLWLLDHTGQRMGTDPSSSDPVAQAKGAPYRLVLPSGEIRSNHADAEGKVAEYDCPNNVVCTLQWGKRPGSPWDAIPDDENELEDFFLYSETIFIGSEPPSGDLPGQHLSNLGYEGSTDECRQGFARDYGGSDDAQICEVHDTGREKTVA